jgi:hypothetical protein
VALGNPPRDTGNGEVLWEAGEEVRREGEFF